MATAQEVLIAWQNSPEHNATMTNPQFTEIGIGRHYGEGSHYGWYWTATYGAGEGVQTAPEPLPAPVEGSRTTGSRHRRRPSLPETVTTVDEAPTVITNDGGVVELRAARDQCRRRPRCLHRRQPRRRRHRRHVHRRRHQHRWRQGRDDRLRAAVPERLGRYAAPRPRPLRRPTSDHDDHRHGAAPARRCRSHGCDASPRRRPRSSR